MRRFAAICEQAFLSGGDAIGTSAGRPTRTIARDREPHETRSISTIFECFWHAIASIAAEDAVWAAWRAREAAR